MKMGVRTKSLQPRSQRGFSYLQPASSGCCWQYLSCACCSRSRCCSLRHRCRSLIHCWTRALSCRFRAKQFWNSVSGTRLGFATHCSYWPRQTGQVSATQTLVTKKAASSILSIERNYIATRQGRSRQIRTVPKRARPGRAASSAA